MAKQKVTLYLDGDLWRQFRAACILNNQSASEVTEELIRLHMGMLGGIDSQIESETGERGTSKDGDTAS